MTAIFLFVTTATDWPFLFSNRIVLMSRRVSSPTCGSKKLTTFERRKKEELDKIQIKGKKLKAEVEELNVQSKNYSIQKSTAEVERNQFESELAKLQSKNIDTELSENNQFKELQEKRQNIIRSVMLNN